MNHTTQTDRAETFLDLHQRPGAFVMPNPWDPGSARILEGLGYPALATTSAGLAFSLGYLDGHLSREVVLAHCHAVARAVDVPVSADLEQGFGDAPRTVAETIRLAAATGLAGGSIEDYSGSELYDPTLAAERIAAAVESKNALGHPFVLTARAENFIRGVADLDDTIERLNRYAECGADVLYAPGLPDLEAVRTVCSSVDKPVNVLVLGSLTAHSVAELAAAGAARLSVGSLLARHVLAALQTAATETATSGTFGWTATLGGGKAIDGVMR
jgi:2-methylisocitrate lyase-like PEP mutase family enzyme